MTSRRANAIFRIRTILENELTSILKIEGSISEDDLSAWAKEIGRITSSGVHQTVLECSSVSSICPEGLNVLLGRLSNGVYLVNCPVGVKNMLQTAGRSKHVLD